MCESGPLIIILPVWSSESCLNILSPERMILLCIPHVGQESVSTAAKQANTIPTTPWKCTAQHTMCSENMLEANKMLRYFLNDIYQIIENFHTNTSTNICLQSTGAGLSFLNQGSWNKEQIDPCRGNHQYKGARFHQAPVSAVNCRRCTTLFILIYNLTTTYCLHMCTAEKKVLISFIFWVIRNGSQFEKF